MKIITMASSKGGVGKSICTSIAAERFLANGVPVHILDLDPQSDQREVFEALHAIYGDQVSLTSMDDLIKMNPDVQTAAFDIIDEAESKEGIMVIDVQGSNNNLLSLAATRADCILVPMVDSPNDLKGTRATIIEFRKLERLLGKKLPVHFFWNKAKGIGLSKDGKEAEEQLKENFSLLGANLVERTPYKYIVTTGRLTKDVKKDPDPKVIAEADGWINRIVELM